MWVEEHALERATPHKAVWGRQQLRLRLWRRRLGSRRLSCMTGGGGRAIAREIGDFLIYDIFGATFARCLYVEALLSNEGSHLSDGARCIDGQTGGKVAPLAA